MGFPLHARTRASINRDARSARRERCATSGEGETGPVFLACGSVSFLSLLELDKPDRPNKPDKPDPAPDDGVGEGIEA